MKTHLCVSIPLIALFACSSSSSSPRWDAGTAVSKDEGSVASDASSTTSVVGSQVLTFSISSTPLGWPAGDHGIIDLTRTSGQPFSMAYTIQPSCDASTCPQQSGTRELTREQTAHVESDLSAIALVDCRKWCEDGQPMRIMFSVDNGSPSYVHCCDPSIEIRAAESLWQYLFDLAQATPVDAP